MQPRTSDDCDKINMENSEELRTSKDSDMKSSVVTE